MDCNESGRNNPNSKSERTYSTLIIHFYTLLILPFEASTL